MYYYVTTTYYCHDMELGTPELHGPFETPEARATDIESKRQEDEWNLEEDSVSLILLDSEAPITAGETMTPCAAAFDE